jgi:hypothetical protein
MSRTVIAVAALFLASAAAAQNCDLGSNAGKGTCQMTLDASGKSLCSLSVTNSGTAVCNGNYVAAWGTLDPGTVTNVSGTGILSTCSMAGTVQLPFPFLSYTQVNSAWVCGGQNVALQPGQTATMTATVSPAPGFMGGPIFGGQFGVASVFTFKQTGTPVNGTISSTGSTPIFILLTNCTTSPTSAGTAPSAIPYEISWGATTGGGPYEVQESTAPDFSNATSVNETNTFHFFQHTVTSATTFYYRVRPVNCSGSAGTFGGNTQIVVLPPQSPSSHDFDLVVPVGTTQQISQDVQFKGLTPNAQFTATVDEPFLSVTPSSGTVPASGTLTVTVKANPNGLPNGASTATVTINLPNGKGQIAPNDSRSTSTTVSVSLTQPVTSTPKSGPPNDALIVPAVAHLEGAATFRSDVRITNTGTTANTYLLSFTPQNSDGTTTGKQTNVTVGGGQTIALNDILKDYFGFADPSAQSGGVLDIRLVSGTAGTTFVASRTYAATANGTYGQFVPAVPLSKFLKTGAGSLTLTQVSQSDKFRSNLGFVEALGFPASIRIRVFNAIGTLLGEFPLTGADALKPFEFRQLSQFLATKNLTNVPDARIEVINDSPNAGITTYASVLDQVTQDPLLVSPIQQANLSANRYVLPGMADFASSFSNFHSDVRIYNGSATTVNATATFYPQGNGAPIAQSISIAPNEIKIYNNVLPGLFNTTGGGAIVVTTPNNVPLIVSGRTYSNADAGGTFGQFIPAVTPADGIGNGDSPLQVLQLEQSANFRSNLGLNELTGNPVTVRVTLIPAGSKTAAVLPDITLNPNEFRQLNSVFAQAYAGQNVYNGRATIQVVGGAGRVTAYGSVVDASTSDPTYVPAQK